MKYTVISWLIFVMVSAQTGSICDSIVKRHMPSDRQITPFVSAGIVLCTRLCAARRRCESGSFQTFFMECKCHLVNGKVESSSTELDHDSDTEFSFFDISRQGRGIVCSSEACPFRSHCNPVNKTHHDCRVTGCIGNADDVKSRHKDVLKESIFRVTLPLVCEPSFMPQGVVMYQSNVTWFTPVCAIVSSCRMVKQYQPDSEDGEYWLRPTNFDYTTHIYCHNMSTSSPKEFLTLPNINYGIYPRIMNKNCEGETDPRFDCTGQGGEIWFSKIKVNITNMEVFRADKTFATISHSKAKLAFGQAFDCYTNDQNNCGEDIKGKFILDLRGTGWRVGEEQKWKHMGHFYKIQIDRQMNGTLITLRCGGFGGGCNPADGKLVFTLCPEHVKNYDP